ncbi:uncharacterized protein LOC125759433 [Rhipicephalus sanguineus]|uniref:uncharacterized protein LOC125759433 n=1 Tax=Rhipicephalus sanguineus TaxID=34632 RepID=UPI0020C23F34|nr:uncharacterized protein LOC125759433 [Rhipicephalus sanguineus]
MAVYPDNRYMDPKLRAREADHRRQRRENDAELRAREAEAKRQRHQDSPDMRAREAEERRQQRQNDAELRSREAEAKRQHRQDHPEVTAREAEERRQQRQENPDLRAREAEARGLRRRADAEQAARERLEQDVRATNMFHKRFTSNPFSYSCSVCDRHKNDLKPLPETHADVVSDAFLTGVSRFQVCRTCMQSIRQERMPNVSTTNGYAYPPKPSHLPKLNVVSEHLVSPRIPFMQIGRLLYSDSGQLAIKGPIVNVPINVSTTVQMPPGDVEEDQALRAQPAVLRYHAYPLFDVINYKREHVLLFDPLRREIYILDNNKFVEIFDN